MTESLSEFEKMRNEEFYDFSSEECLASYYRAKHLCAKLQTMTIEDADYRETIEALIPGIPESSSDSHWDRYLGMTAAMTQIPVPTAE